ncbi:MAG: GAF domain-containing protein [Anaerolineales bacterium]|nr:GAF domain-containing protein [Anaerolineales bacterium]
MCKKSIWQILLLSLFLTSCGITAPTPTPEESPTASPSEPVAAPASLDPFIPYGKNIRFDHISLEEGLSQSVVNAILQDQRGFLWVGTDDGLNRYDGYNFKTYKPDANNPFSLSDRSITAIVEDREGILWVGTRQGGLNRYDPITGKFTFFRHDKDNDQSLASNHITTLSLSYSGLWIGTNNGLDYLDFRTFTFTHYRDDSKSPVRLSSNFITSLMLDSQGILWIGTVDSGLNVYDPENNSLSIYKNNKNQDASLSHNRILSIVERENGEVWVGTANGLNRLNKDAGYFTRFQYSQDDPGSLAGNIIYALYVDRLGGLWVGTNEGLDRYDFRLNTFQHHQYQPNIPNSLSHNQVYSIYEDDSGVLWVGTFGGGLNKYNRQQDRFAYYRSNPNDPNSLSSNFLFAMLADQRGFVWIGTFEDGLNRFDPRTDKFLRFMNDPNDPTSISNNSIITLYTDRAGTLWVGTGNALEKYDPVKKSFTHFKPSESNEPELTRFSVYAILEDSRGTLWVGSNRGLFSFDRETNIFSQYIPHGRDAENFNNIKINVIFEDKNQTLWIGTFDDGLKSIDYETGELTNYRHDPDNETSIGSNSILCMYQDAAGSLWIGTHGGGLDRFEPKDSTFAHFTEIEGLPNNVIYGILEDESGSLWLSTNFGISRFTPKNGTFRNFTVSDGLQSNEFNQNAYAKDLNGTMYFGGINGLNIFQPTEIKDNPYPPQVSITSITLDGVPLVQEHTPEYTQNIVLQWPQDSFEFEFAAFAYEQSSKNQYSYTLEGFDPSWIDIGTRRNGRYTNLPGGTYTLRLRGSNSDGTWNEQERSIEVTVVPPFWETWWFSSLLIIAMVLGVAGGLRWRVKSIENRNHELERLVRKRTADLEKRNSEIEALYQADEKILRSVTLNHIFQTLVDVSVSMLKADRSVVFTWNEEKRKVMPRVSQGFAPESLAAMHFNRDEGVIGLAMKSGTPVVVSDIHAGNLREDILEVIQKEGIQSFAHFPIVVDEKVMAIFNVAYTRPNALNKDAIRLFTALVNRASMSIANMELFEQTKDLAVMEARNRLARDLHDSAKQKAFAALAQLGTVNGMVRAVPHDASPHLSEAETLVYEVIQELNFLIQEIYPIALQEKGLQTVLREYIFEWEHRNDAMVNLMIQSDCALPLETEQAVYRVIQEALANISRHSHAQRVDISLVYNPDLLQVTIADDGRGFDMNQKAKGLGFRSMRERISSIRGTFQVQSAPGQGTRIIIQIPIKETVGV